MSRLKSERGFTLMELMVGMVLGTIIMLAGFGVVDAATKSNKQISDRQDALQRGRIALEQITRELRSQVCVGTATPVAYADDNTVKFYSYLGDPTGGTTTVAKSIQTPDMRVISYVPGTSGKPGTITEKDYTVTSTDAPVTTASTPWRQTILATNVYPPTVTTQNPTPPNGGKFFRYFPIGSTTPLVPNTTNYPNTGLSPTDLSSVADTSIGFLVVPTGSSDAKDPRSTEFQDDVTWRGLNPENASYQPCAGN
jgi:prepilin-type N-terminal cleavage/methylation domain-containing protein